MEEALIIPDLGIKIQLTMALLRRDPLHHTYADYFSWPDDERYELIDGVAYVKEPPAPSRSHQELVGELYHQIRLALEGKRWRAYVAPFDVRLPKAGEPDDLIDTVVQPDVVIVRDLSKLDKRGMRGAPDWIAEVLSPATTSHDQIVKIPVYERAGVLEVWLVHPIDRTLTIHRLENERYGIPIVVELKGRTAINALPGVSIDWERLPAVLT
ncbi:MAG TPA: Uma2 family endonuclease [Steroidobacteraceae bacterium]|jgi:Uma2 family endonuclease|nr:Uma2 family endonuclease [Steroidobacteraceae bacterium]